jgi:23S rRNA G2445 N2-methylase RlmL
MARIADIGDDDTVLDPCCGAGTILLEAHTCSPTATFIGRDTDPHAIAAARHNGAGRAITWGRGDASAIEASPGGVDRIVTNPPWGVRRTAGNLAAFLAEWRRIIRPDGLLVVLLDETQESALARDPGWAAAATYPLSVAGRHPRIILALPR